MKNNKSADKASILIIYTGGTIGMKQDPSDLTLKPFDFSQILDEIRLPDRHLYIQSDNRLFRCRAGLMAAAGSADIRQV